MAISAYVVAKCLGCTPPRVGRHRDPESIEYRRRFYDRYLKADDYGRESTPRVRYSILDPCGEDDTNLTTNT